MTNSERPHLDPLDHPNPEALDRLRGQAAEETESCDSVTDQLLDVLLRTTPHGVPPAKLGRVRGELQRIVDVHAATVAAERCVRAVRHVLAECMRGNTPPDLGATAIAVSIGSDLCDGRSLAELGRRLSCPRGKQTISKRARQCRERHDMPQPAGAKSEDACAGYSALLTKKHAAARAAANLDPTDPVAVAAHRDRIASLRRRKAA